MSLKGSTKDLYHNLGSLMCNDIGPHIHLILQVALSTVEHSLTLHPFF